jgi:serine/threonine protein phosphatase 1
MARYAFADIHGRMDILKKIIDKIEPGDVVYCLGDCGDRGPNSWECIKTVLAHPQIIYLKGNHEDMLVKAFRSAMMGDQSDYHLLHYNGGAATFEKLISEEDPVAWIDEIAKLPTISAVMNSNSKVVILYHAGYTPGKEIPSTDDILWDREHFSDPWPAGFSDTIMVHGHTPISYLKEQGIVKPPKAGKGDNLFYADGHKICIDTGAVQTGVAVLLDLDTFEIHRIYGDEWNDLFTDNIS